MDYLGLSSSRDELRRRKGRKGGNNFWQLQFQLLTVTVSNIGGYSFIFWRLQVLSNEFMKCGTDPDACTLGDTFVSPPEPGMGEPRSVSLCRCAFDSAIQAYGIVGNLGA